MKKRLLLFSAMVVAAGSFFLFLGYCRENNISDGAGKKAIIEKSHSAYHMDKKYYGNLEKISLDENEEGKIYGGITSHHFLAAKEIAKFFLALRKQSPRTVAIIGPNHFNVGRGDILVSRYPFRTPWGTVYPDEGVINGLIAKKTALNDEDPFSEEHSISALVGFMKLYLPDTKIVPVIVKRETSPEKAENLAKVLNEVLPDDAVVVSSVDFSHHLGKTASVFHDERSISAIKGFEYERVLGSEIDSPVSIYALLRYLDMRGAHEVDYENLNSTDLLGNKFSDDVTSYLFARFGKGDVQADDKISVLSFGDALLSPGAEGSAGNGADLSEKIAGPEGNFLRGVDLIFLGDSSREDYAEKEINGRKIVFLKIDEASDSGNLEKYSDLIRKVKDDGGYVMVDIRWKKEYQENFPEIQKSAAHLLIDSGADAVFGRDPDAIGPVEIYKDKAIFYSLGSLVSGQTGGKTDRGLGAGAVFSGNGAKYFLFPYEVKDSQPDLFSAKEAGIFCDDYLSGIQGHSGCEFETESNR